MFNGSDTVVMDGMDALGIVVVMERKLPLDEKYKSRQDAMQAMREAVEDAGHAVAVDKNTSSRKRVVVRCPSLFRLSHRDEKGEKKVCVTARGRDGGIPMHTQGG